MRVVPTLHIRNVPKGVYEGLRRRADRSGRSLNAEVIETLTRSLERERRRSATLRRLDELRSEFLLPDAAPKPEDVIRELRDAEPRGL